jgi:spore coat polysaccharide biosynthesis predicted glycosyltransferase SpsG
MAFDQMMDPNVPFTIVYGAAYPHLKLLPDFSSRRQATVVSALANMAARLVIHQYAIVAAGSTMFECAACALPFAAIVVAENQIASAKYFRDNYNVPVLENVNCALNSDDFAKLCVVVADQTEDVEQLQRRGKTLWRDFHDNGAQSLADALLKKAAV